MGPPSETESLLWKWITTIIGSRSKDYDDDKSGPLLATRDEQQKVATSFNIVIRRREIFYRVLELLLCVCVCRVEGGKCRRKIIRNIVHTVLL